MDYSETLTSRQRVLRAINHQQADRVPIDLGGFQTGIHKKACLKRAKSEAGLSDYEVRTWADWHHHQTLSLIALWFLILETRRGEKIYPCTDGSAGSDYIVRTVASSLRPKISRLGQTLYQAKKQTQRACSVLSLQTT